MDAAPSPTGPPATLTGCRAHTGSPLLPEAGTLQPPGPRGAPPSVLGEHPHPWASFQPGKSFLNLP